MRLKVAPLTPVSEPNGARPLSDLTRLDPSPSPIATRGHPNTCFALKCSIDSSRQKGPCAPIALPPTSSSKICFTLSNLFMAVLYSPTELPNGESQPVLCLARILEAPIEECLDAFLCSRSPD